MTLWTLENGCRLDRRELCDSLREVERTHKKDFVKRDVCETPCGPPLCFVVNLWTESSEVNTRSGEFVHLLMVSTIHRQRS